MLSYCAIGTSTDNDFLIAKVLAEFDAEGAAYVLDEFEPPTYEELVAQQRELLQEGTHYRVRLQAYLMNTETLRGRYRRKLVLTFQVILCTHH